MGFMSTSRRLPSRASRRRSVSRFGQPAVASHTCIAQTSDSREPANSSTGFKQILNYWNWASPVLSLTGPDPCVSAPPAFLQAVGMQLIPQGHRETPPGRLELGFTFGDSAPVADLQRVLLLVPAHAWDGERVGAGDAVGRGARVQTA
jgi:hypothetical protein